MINNKSLISDTSIFGGESEEWNIFSDVGQHIEKQYPLPVGEDTVINNNQYQIYGIGKKRKIDMSKLLYPLTVDFSKYETNEELYHSIKKWWIETKKKSEKTIDIRIRTARQFEHHSIYPINWLVFDNQPEQVINLLMYLENVEYKEKGKEKGIKNYGIHQIHNLWKTIGTFAEAKGIYIAWWPYILPERPENKVKNIPSPIIVNKLIHYKYSNDKYINSLIKTILTVGFYTGLRPEEITELKVGNIDFDNGLIVITEQKKRHRNRQIRVEKPVMYSRQQNSLSNYICIWRKKITDINNGILFLKPNGKPFETEDDLRGFLADYVKPIWNPFCPKIMRDWFAIAKLIRTKIETGKWDIYEVERNLGHSKVSTTEIYIEFAEMYYENFKFDWLRSVLKFHSNSKRMNKLMKEDYRTCKKSTNGKNGLGLIKFSPVGKYAPVGEQTEKI